MSPVFKKARSLFVTVLLVAATNAAISYTGGLKSGVPVLPDMPRPKSGVPVLPDMPRPKSGVPVLPDMPRPRSGVPVLPDMPRP
ncbi:MAG: hypothetical protein WB626_01315 [Bacteroidota bacterium]